MKNETIQPSATEQAIAKIEFTDAKAFESIVAAINGLADKYRGLQITDTESYKIVVKGIAEMRNLRISVENRRKEKKATILAAGRQIDSGAKKIAELLWPIENDLQATKQAEDTRKEAIKIEKEQAEKERIEIIQAKIASFPPDMSRLPQLLKIAAPEIQAMQDALATVEINIEVYQEFTPEAITAKTDKARLLREYYIARIQADAEAAKQKAEVERQEQNRKAEEEAFRIEQERLENEHLARVEAQRIIDEKAEKEREAETARQEESLKKQEEEQRAKQKIEDDRLAKIREEQETATQQIRDAQTKLDAQKCALQKERDRIEHEKAEQIRLEQEKQAQAEREKIAKIEADRQEQARIEKEATEKIAREKAEADERARQETLRPDRENLLLYLDTLTENINSTVEPVIKTSEGKVVLSNIKTYLARTITDSRQIITDM